jgi:hypothetical protein
MELLLLLIAQTYAFAWPALLLLVAWTLNHKECALRYAQDVHVTCALQLTLMISS